MGYQCTGFVSIPLEELWGWFFEKSGCNLNVVFDASKMAIDNDTQSILFVAKDGVEYSLELVAFWEFVLQYTPDFGPANYLFGVPVNDSDWFLEVPFCANTESIEGSSIPGIIAIRESWKSISKKHIIDKKV